MLVEFRTSAQASRVGDSLGLVPFGLSESGVARFLCVDDVDAARPAIESVTRMFRVFIDESRQVEVPNGWTFTAAKFEVEWPEDRSVVRSHFGARRKAFNWALDRVKADMAARDADPEHQSVKWEFIALRNAWNQSKDEVAPWWAENSKESYASGINDLATALKNWDDSKKGRRKGRRVGFPKFQSRHDGRNRVTFTTGAMRLNPDRRTIVIPVIGRVRCKENTRRVERKLADGDAHILSMTLSEQWGRLFVSVAYQQRTPTSPRQPARPDSTVGVDLGLRDLATVVDTDGNVTVYANPKPLKNALADMRRASRELSRRIPGSRGHNAAKAKLTKCHRKAVNIRREAAHQLTTELARTHGTIVIEDLDLAAMKRSMGRRAFRRSVSDAALGQIRPMLEYKTQRHGSTLVIADRWFPSSQLHHGCGTPGCRLHAERRLDKHLVCPATGEIVDRDINAAHNLRDWTRESSTGAVSSGVPHDSSQTLRTESRRAGQPNREGVRGTVRPSPPGEARSNDTKTSQHTVLVGHPARGSR